MAAKKDIPPQTAFLYVPQNLMINEKNIRTRCPEMAEIYDRHPELFKKHYDAEYLVIICYVLAEMLKGDKSFWHPYF